MKLKFVLVLLAFCLLHSLASARYVQTCKAKYKRNYDWSDYYTVTVYFYKGSELNKATSSYDYDSYSVYSVIFWGDDKVTVIQLSGYFSCGTEVSIDCISRSYGNLEGEDQEGRNWEICTKQYCY